jgi:SNF2-related domain
VSTITTILDNRPRLQNSKPGTKHPPEAVDLIDRKKEEELWKKSLSEWKNEMEMNSIPPKLYSRFKGAGSRAGTLVICPLIALYQWKSEIEKFVEPGALTVGIYHGPNRATEMTLDMMQEFDIVLTTYQVLECEFRSMVSPNKVACPNCGSKFKFEKLKVHLKYFCGEFAKKTEAQARQRRTRDTSGGGLDVSHGKDKSKSESKKALINANNKATGGTIRKSKASSGVTRKEYDSDSDISTTDHVLEARVSRPAAVAASRRLSTSVMEWGREDAKRSTLSADDRFQSDSSFSTASDGSDDESESDEPDSLKSRSRPRGVDVESQIREKQRQALENAKALNIGRHSSKSSKHTTAKKIPSAKLGKKQLASTKRPTPAKRSTKGKTFASSSSDGSDSDDPVDPLSGIDMDELMAEAMTGSRMSLLHSLTWWRIVLDEAHFVKSRSSSTAGK